ncbi:MAG TPA: serine/threonine-protein kinase [Vicinamibacteria bacterium]|nr:serine/threonine-protein kinase [Vicinamibacteria bacterium]
MTDPRDRWRVVDALFDAALDLPPRDRPAFLDANCPPELRTRVDALIASSSRIDTFLPAGAGLQGAIADSLFDALENGEGSPGDAHPGATIDEYRLVARLGEGGMGEVWEAEQASPVRRVALKLLKLGMDSKRVVARFESERQALALMNHRNVAQVFGGGATPSGRPYFVMELVHGPSVTDYARRRGLDLRARLRLFLDVCEGVQHAHHKGIVHRDLKPSNILVTEEEGTPVPKIIDFGVARALDTRLSAETFVTEQGQIIGTPEYMSPEQADPGTGDIDTRADVYALGVLLYELLAGVRPFDAEELRTLGFLELLRRIRETEPPRPSQRADSTQGKRLRGDLDWIVMKALEKDRARRYVSPHEMADDVRRHLANQPVLAGPPSRSYRLRKLVRRHRGSMAAATLALVALLTGAVVAATQAVRATRAELAARAEAETARQVSDFMVELFEVSDPRVARGHVVTARELLDRGAERMQHQLTEQPLVQARLQAMMGRTYRNLGEFEPATGLLAASLKTRETLLGAADPETVRTLTALARLELDRKDYARGEAMFRDALDRTSHMKTPDRVEEARIRCHLGNVLMTRARYAEAEDLLRSCRDALIRELGPDDAIVASAWGDLGNVLNLAGRRVEAETAYRRTIDIRSARDPDDPRLAVALNNLGSLLTVTKRPAEAEPYVERAKAIEEKVYGPEHPRLAGTLGTLGLLHRRQGRLDASAADFARALAIREKIHGRSHAAVAEVLNDVGYTALLRGDLAAARAALDRALGIDLAALGPDHLQTAATYVHLGALRVRRGELDAADVAYARALAAIEKVRGPEAAEAVACLVGLAEVALRRGHLADADALLARAERLGEASGDLATVLNTLGALRLRQGRPHEARAVLDRARALQGEEDLVRAETLARLGDVLVAQALVPSAEPQYREALELRTRVLGPAHPDTVAVSRALAALSRPQ